MDIQKETACPCCGSIKVIEFPALYTSSIEEEMLGSEPGKKGYAIYRCLVCGREFGERRKQQPLLKKNI